MAFIKHPYVTDGASHSGDGSAAVTSTLAKVLAEVRKDCGVDFTFYKSNTIQRRIDRRITINQLQSLDEYYKLILESPQEVNTLYNELLIGVTRFFRDSDSFEKVQEVVVPEICDRVVVPNQQIRIWIAGCSTGEEAYSIAACFLDYIDRHNLLLELKIFATDVDKRSLELAGQGRYPDSVVANIPPDLLQNYFTPQGGRYVVSERLRKCVIFAQHNLIKDPPFNQLDMVTCRNLLIYLQSAAQSRVLTEFAFALKQGGFLFLGSSESTGEQAEHFETVDTHHKIYRNKSGGRLILDDTNLNNRTFGQRSGTITRTQADLQRQRSLLVPHQASKPYGNAIDMIYRQLMKHFVPPSVVVNERNQVINIFGDVNPYLRLPEGDSTNNLSRMTSRELGYSISSVLQQARDSGSVARFSGVELTPTGEPLDLIATTLFDMDQGENIAVISFMSSREVKEAIPMLVEGVEVVDTVIALSDDARIQELEKQLFYAQERLHASTEALETSNEELQATNEELTASNEELQSTNEELQSVNEELYTVNAQYQLKIDELMQLNSDMDILLEAASMGVIYLDPEFRIRQVTYDARHYFNILEQDTGRPITHISHKLNITDLEQRLEQTRTDYKAHELYVSLSEEDNPVLLMRIRPNLEEDNRTLRGILITILDMSEYISHWKNQVH